MNYIKLGDCADISTGLVLKRKEASRTDKKKYPYKTITLRSLEQDGWLNEEYFDKFKSSEKLEDRYLTQIGDVIIRLSAPYTAIAIQNSQVGLVIPSLCAIIRNSSSEIISGYLAFLLNSDIMKKEYLRSSLGATIPVIRMTDLKETNVPVLPIEMQNKTIEISNLIIAEKKLYHQLLESKDIYYKEITNKIILGGKKND
ncbi:MAG: restriction endonuclease subunit S [Tenericutes bacterium]|nr:restriction endonuclease subunit S [Mycoplasmatota bacterium]